MWFENLPIDKKMQVEKLMLKREKMTQFACEMRSNKNARKFARRAIERFTEKIERVKSEYLQSDGVKNDRVYKYMRKGANSARN